LRRRWQRGHKRTCTGTIFKHDQYATLGNHCARDSLQLTEGHDEFAGWINDEVTQNRTLYEDNSEVLAGVLSADYTKNGTPGVATGHYSAR